MADLIWQISWREGKKLWVESMTFVTSYFPRVPGNVIHTYLVHVYIRNLVNYKLYTLSFQLLLFRKILFPQNELARIQEKLNKAMPKSFLFVNQWNRIKILSKIYCFCIKGHFVCWNNLPSHMIIWRREWVRHSFRSISIICIERVLSIFRDARK